MAFKGNQGEVVVQKNFKTIYGIAPFKVVAINPSMDELIALGIKAQKESEYVGDDKTRIEIWCRSILPETKAAGQIDKSLEELGIGDQLVTKMAVFVSNKDKGKSDGSTQTWINNFGQICSVNVGETPSASWWKKSGERVSKEGEIELIKFIRAWLNMGPDDESYIDDWGKLVAGNVKELKDIMKDYKDNVVRSMIEVKHKDGKTFASIGNRHHEPWNITGTAGWSRAYKMTPIGTYFSYQLQEFTPQAVTPTDDPAVAADESEWGA